MTGVQTCALPIFIIPIINNNVIEGNKTVNLALFNPQPTNAASLGRSTATLTIVDVNRGPGVLGFATNLFRVSETGGVAVITVTRTNGSTGPVSINYSTADGTGVSGVNYRAVSGQLNFADGQTSRTFTIPVINDNVPIGDRSVQLTLSGVTGGATVGLGSSALLILDAQISNGRFQFATNNFSVMENAGVAVVSVFRTNGSQGTVTVNYATLDGTAHPGGQVITCPDRVVESGGGISVRL